MVFGSHKVELSTGKTRSEICEVQRSCQHGDYGRNFETHLEGSTHRDRACWHLWQSSNTEPTESAE